MTPWREKPGGFSGIGGYGGDSMWLGNAKRQSLFRANPGPIAWAGKSSRPGMTQPAQPAMQSNRQVGQPAPGQQPAQQPQSMFSADPFGASPEVLSRQAADSDQQMEDIRRTRAAMNDGSYYKAMGVDPSRFMSGFSLFA